MQTDAIKKSPFIVFEGIDGSGKSTQLKLLSQKLSENNIKNVCHFEPTDSVIGKEIRKILSGEQKVDPRTMALLFAADRIEHITCKGGILDNIENGTAVLSDRYYFSSYAYQMVDMPLEWVMDINRVASTIAKPDFHIFVDVLPEVCLERIKNNRTSIDIFENKARLTLARDNFLKIIEKTSATENVIIIDGSKNLQEVSDDIWKNIKRVF